jgi:hypothetical protein
MTLNAGVATAANENLWLETCIKADAVWKERTNSALFHTACTRLGAWLQVCEDQIKAGLTQALLSERGTLNRMFLDVVGLLQEMREAQIDNKPLITELQKCRRNAVCSIETENGTDPLSGLKGLYRELLGAYLQESFPEAAPGISSRLTLVSYAAPFLEPAAEIFTLLEHMQNPWLVDESDGSSKKGLTYPFSAASLKEWFSVPSSNLNVLYYDNKPAYFGLYRTDPHSLKSETRKKIFICKEQGEVRSVSVDGWVFLACADHDARSDLYSSLKGDVYSWFMNTVGNVSIACGDDSLFGVVRTTNQARESHERAGFQTTSVQLPSSEGEYEINVINLDLWRETTGLPAQPDAFNFETIVQAAKAGKS